jgi:hypothetical protein
MYFKINVLRLCKLYFINLFNSYLMQNPRYLAKSRFKSALECPTKLF